MPFSVEQCANFEGNVCKKCGRMLPAMCKDQEDIEVKARKFDELMAAQEETEVPLAPAPASPSTAEVSSAKPLVKKVMLPKGK